MKGVMPLPPARQTMSGLWKRGLKWKLPAGDAASSVSPIRVPSSRTFETKPSSTRRMVMS